MKKRAWHRADSFLIFAKKYCNSFYILQVQIKCQVVQVFISYTHNILLMETNFPLNMDLSLNETFPALDL